MLFWVVMMACGMTTKEKQPEFPAILKD